MADIPHDSGPDREPQDPPRSNAGIPAGARAPVDWDAVARHLAGEGTPDERERVERWLQTHPTEAGIISVLDRAISLHVHATPAAGVDVEAALRRVTARRDAEPAGRSVSLAEEGVLPHRPSTRATAPASSRTGAPRWRAPALRAAALVAVLAGAATLWRQTREASSDGSAGVARYATAVGERDSLRLPDGSRVVLGPGSTLETVAGYGGAERVVELRGEAYFHVRHDAARPFVVRTPTATVEDLGTAFVVRGGANGRVTVAVTEGAVRLHGPGGTGAAADSGVVLRAGDRGALEAGGRPVAERGAAGPAELAWTEGRLVFEDARATDVAAALRRWYGVELRFADAALADRPLTASFRDEDVADVLRVVALALGASMERRGDTVVVRTVPAGAGAP